MSEEKYFNSRWLVEYEDQSGQEKSVYIDADYEVYSEERVRELFAEIHPEWSVRSLLKVEKLPWEE